MNRRALPRTSLLLAAIVAGCAPPAAADPDGGAPVDAALVATRDDAAVEVEGGSAGCGRAGAATGRVSIETEVGGVARHYDLVVPEPYDARRSLPVVFVFHGLGGDGAQIRSYLGLESVAGADALHVYPDGLPAAAAGGRTGWAPEDLAFVDAMRAEIAASYCVDEARLFAIGHSYGAYMTNLVGCERGDVFRGIAPISGGSIGGTCRRAVPAWIAHGTADATVPMREGTAARDAWLAQNACDSTTTPVEPSPCVAYACPSEAPVVWCAFEGGHFPLPDFTRGAIWSFFRGL